MRTLPIAVLLALALSFTLSAATINANCTVQPVQFNLGTGTGSVNCSSFNSFAIANATLTGVSLRYVGDYVLDTSVFSPAASTVTIQFTPTGGGYTFSPATASVIMSNVAGSFLKANNSPVPANATTWNAASNITVGLQSSVAPTTGANVLSSNGSVIVTYTYTVVPEPGTVSMIGLGMLGLSAFARKFRRS